MKKKLLIVAGAGASVEFGMPSVREIDRLFEEWAMEIAPGSGQDWSLYTIIKEFSHAYYSRNNRNRLGVLSNFERTLFTIQSLHSIVSDREGQYNHNLGAFVDMRELPEIIKFRNEIGKVEGFDFHHLYSRLIDQLLQLFRSRCMILSTQKASELQRLTKLIDALQLHFEIGVINLNYDNVLLSASLGLKTGFNSDTGLFDKRIVYSSGWNFIYHLHGSVHFDLKGQKHDMHQIMWNQDLNSTFAQNSSGRGDDTTTEGNSHIHSAIITGLDKTNQLLKEPFMTYYSQTVRFAYEADAILFLGYGFGDKHLNRCFNYNRFDGKRRKIVVIDWADMKEDGLQFRHDHWTYGLFSALPYNAHEMLVEGSSLPYPAHHFKNSNRFEKSSNPDLPMSVWYNGLLAACDNYQLVLNELLN